MKRGSRPPRCLVSLPRFQPPATHVKLRLSRMAGQGPLQQLQEPPSSAGFSDWACSFYKKRRPHPPSEYQGEAQLSLGPQEKLLFLLPFLSSQGLRGHRPFNC